jgi:glycosyltransferase involved in cell wall biosynthesis
MKKIKILYVSSTAELGGGEVSLLSLLKGLDGNFVLPLAVVPSNGPLLDKLKKQAIDVRLIPLMEFSRKNCLLFLLATLRLAFLIRKEKIDLVHANSIYISEQSLFAARMSKVPCICHVRDLAPILGAGKIRSIAFKKMNKFIAISEAVKKDLTGKLNIPENKVIRIYNGVDLKDFSPNISADKVRNEFNLSSKKVVGMIGRFSPEKGQETFLMAAAEVLKVDKDVNFIIAGGAKLGSEAFMNEMVSLAKKLGLQDNIIFTGFRDDLASVLAALDVLVVPSQAEPFGRVIIEAFACGIPVIAANSGAAAEVISKESGILVEANNIGGFKEAIIELLNNPQQSKLMGEEGRKVVFEKFSIHKHVLAVEKLYREIIGEKKAI